MHVHCINARAASHLYDVWSTLLCQRCFYFPFIMPALQINAERLNESLAQMATIGALPHGGCCRLALTDEDKAARDLFCQWSRDAGCDIRIDAIGNVFAVRAGERHDGQVVLTGSHLDTQPHGGRLDGVYGVLAGLEIMRTLHDARSTTPTALAVACWTNEEGARFDRGLTGSSVFTGTLPLAEALAMKVQAEDSIGNKTVETELARIGYAGKPDALGLTVRAYLEAHIEQGPILEDQHKTIGIVTGAQAARWYAVELHGADRHAGTTPMQNRSDALMAAARLMLMMREAALKLAPDIHLTVGRVRVTPDASNTVPGDARFMVDLRHPEERTLDAVEAALNALLAQVETLERVQAHMQRHAAVSATPFDDGCVAAVRAAAAACGYPTMTMVSGAMHDACRLARFAPSAMVFVPSHLGISHHEAEWTEPQDLAAGAQVLLQALLHLAQ